VVGLLTGNPAEDNQILDTVAMQNGVSAAVLARYVDEYKQQREKDAPGIIQEYNYLKANGQFNGSITEYMKYKANLGDNGGANRGTIISQEDANYIGIPTVAGYSKDQIIYDLAASSTAPKWFIDTIGGARASIDPLYAQTAWDKVKNDPTVKNYTKGISKTNTTDLSSLTQTANQLYKAKTGGVE
jgi:hypothetical protein